MLTLNLIKRRSEHYDGELKNLEEITLHQFDLENIDLLGKTCPRLKILYLQGNQLTALPLMRLHHLDTLMLQMNNLQDVYGIQECTNLRVLDLTLNFIKEVECLYGLTLNKKLRELTLEGNPVHSDEKYHPFVLSTLNLTTLDHKHVDRSQQLSARQLNLDHQNYIEKYLESYKPLDFVINEADCRPDPNITADEFANQICAHSIEQRIKTARELKIIRNRDEPKPSTPATRKYVDDSGKVLQCNELDLKFKYITTNSTVTFKLYIPKAINTCLVTSCMHPDHVKVEISNKVFQVKSLDLMDVERYDACRSKASGVLLLTAYKKGHANLKLTPSETALIETKTILVETKYEAPVEITADLEYPQDMPELI